MRHNLQFTISAVNFLYQRTERIAFLDHKIWSILADILKISIT